MICCKKTCTLVKKILVYAIAFFCVATIVLSSVAWFNGHGIFYIPERAKELVKHYVRRGGTSVSNAQLLETYLQLSVTQIFQSKQPAAVNHESTLGFDISFYDYNEFRLIFSELFIEECYQFTPTNKDPFIIDCGGNIGMATLYFKMRWPQSRVLVFEPEPHSFALLQQNMAQNHLENIQTINKALSDHRGTCNFVDPFKGSTWAGMIFDDKPRNPTQLITVECDQLSAYITQPVDLLKIDVEGAEGLVLKDLDQNKKFGMIKEMMIEYHSHGPTLGSILATLDANNFEYTLKHGQSLMIYAHNKAFARPSA